MTEFKIGDVVRFSEEGLHNYPHGEKQMEACRKLRFLVKGLGITLDRWGNRCFLMERIDKVAKGAYEWTPTYFEMAGKEVSNGTREG